MKIGCVVITCAKPEYRDKRYAIMETWGRDFDKLYIISDPGDTDNCFESVNPTNPSLTHKMVKGLTMARDDGVDWCVSTCEDVYIRRPQLEKFLEKADPTCVYGHLIQQLPFYGEMRYPAGPGVFIPKKIITRLVVRGVGMYGPINDAWLGLMCQDLGVEMKDTGLLQNTEADITHPDWISVHHVKPDWMRGYYADTHPVS